MQWKFRHPELIEDLPSLEKVLWHNRGLSAQSSAFFSPPSPLDISAEEVGINPEELKKAVVLIHESASRGDTFLIVGDYDADGVSASSVLWQGLRAVGITSQVFIPERDKHGYGLSPKTVTEVLQIKPDVVITVDNGIVALEAVKELQQAGLKVIVTDHHVPEQTAQARPSWPEAEAVVHTTQLSGTGVAWFLARSVVAEVKKDWRSVSQQWLDAVAVASLADQIPLLGMNRALVMHGLKQLRKAPQPGMASLIAAAGLRPAAIDVWSVVFGIAPRLNAMGRVKYGLAAFELLTADALTADQLAQTVHETNVERQSLTEDQYQLAAHQAKQQLDHHMLIIADPRFHEGVVGLLAGRLVDEFSRPAVVIAVREKIAKASVRSIVGVNVIELLRQVRDDLVDVGGHPMAAGFSVLPANIPIITRRLQTLATAQIPAQSLVASLDIEAQLDPSLSSLETWQLLQKLRPFGQANPEPLLSLHTVTVLETRTIGKMHNHLKLTLQATRQTPVITALGWRQGHHAAQIPVGATIDIAGKLDINDYRGRQSVQWVLKAFRSASIEVSDDQ